jgi:hypothetical protein
MPSLAVATGHTAGNRLASGSSEAWKMAPAVSETWRRQARRWIFGRVPSHLPSRPPQSAQAEPAGQRSLSTAARRCASAPYAARDRVSPKPRTRDAGLPAIPRLRPMLTC